MRPRISIIVPCYNGEKYLCETLDCLQKQTIEDWECIIVNDGSTDGSLEIMKEYAAKDSRYKYIDKENEGPSVARNVGASNACGDFLMFLDADDIIASCYLEKGLTYLRSHTNCSLYYSQTAYIGSKDGIMNNKFTSYKDLLAQNSIVCTCIIKRMDFIRVHGFDPNLRGYEDWEFFIRLLYNNDNVYQEQEVMFYYRIYNNPNSVNLHAKQRENKLRDYFFRKHYDKYIEYYGYPQWVYSQYNRLEKEIDGFINSKSYKLGKAILNPLNWIKDIKKK